MCRPRLVAPILLLLFLLAPMARSEWNDFEGFFELLAEEGVRLVYDDRPDLVAIIGSAPADMSPRHFMDYVRNGGTLFVASEERSVEPILAKFSLGLGPSIVLTFSAADSFQGQFDFPIISDLDRRETPGLFDGVSRIATNRAVEVTGGGRAIAHFPTGSISSWSPAEILSGRKAAFCRIVRLGSGAVIAAGDQSIAIDLMIGEEDNARFLRNVLRAARTRRAMVTIDGNALAYGEGKQPSRGSLPDIPFAMPEVDPRLEDFNLLIADLQRSFPMQDFGRRVLPAVLLVGGLVLFLLLLREILNTHVPGDRPAGSAAAAGGSSVVAARRLVGLAPRSSRPRLLALASRSRKERAFNRFIEELLQSQEGATHGP